MDELDELILELGNECLPDFDKTLKELKITVNEVADLAAKDIAEHKRTAEEAGVTHFEKPMIWYDLVNLCKQELTESKLELLVWLMSGGEFAIADSFANRNGKRHIAQCWITWCVNISWLKEQLSLRRKKNAEFAEILRSVTHNKRNNAIKTSEDHLRVFRMLCDIGYADDCYKKENLQNNLECIDSLMSEHPCLLPIAPLVYFQMCVYKKKKLFTQDGYTPVLKNLFNRKEYIINRDNGKNFESYADYCELYIDLIDCFPQADKPLCDAGFIYCSNLADWCFAEAEDDGRIPLTAYGITEAMEITLFDNPSEDIPAWREMNVDVEQLWDWQEKYTEIKRAAENATANLNFSELPEFLRDSGGFLSRLFEGDFLASVKPKYFTEARHILLDEIIIRFYLLLDREIGGILAKYIGEKA